MKYRLLLNPIVSIIIAIGLLSFNYFAGHGAIYCDKYCKQKIEFHVDPLGKIENPCANGEIPYILETQNNSNSCVHTPPGFKYSSNNDER
jgi:hypothetical protein